MNAPLLELRGLSRTFGSLSALQDVSTSVDRGTIRGLIGPNGAGKTTLLNVLTGFMPASSGHILLDGERIDGKPAHVRVRLGVGRTFQTPQLAMEMTVLDNVVVGAHQRLGAAALGNVFRRGRAKLGQIREEAAALAARLGLEDVLAVPAGELSYGHMRLLEIARALMARPRLLLLDEPVAGMNETESEPLARIIRSLPADGVSVLLVEHDMPFVMGLCDRVTVLDHGVLLAEGTPAAIQEDERVVEIYLGAAP